MAKRVANPCPSCKSNMTPGQPCKRCAAKKVSEETATYGEEEDAGQAQGEAANEAEKKAETSEENGTPAKAETETEAAKASGGAEGGPDVDGKDAEQAGDDDDWFNW